MGVAESIGGFFVSLGLVTDRQSFRDGVNGITSVEKSLKKIVGASAAAATALTGVSAAASQLEMESLKTAHAIGVSATSLDRWKVAAGVAGVNAKGLTAEMLNLERKMQRIKLGDVDTSLAKSLGMLRMNYGQFAGMNAEERMLATFRNAGALEDQRKAAILVGDVLGSAAQEYYQYLQLTGKSLDEELQKAQRLVFTDDQTKRDSLEFMYELKGLLTGVKNIANLLGAQIGKQLTPVIKNFKDLIARNNELIKTGIVGFVEKVGAAFNAVAGVIERVSPVVGALVDRMGGLDRVIEAVGIGILTIKAANVVGGIAKVVSSIGLLRSAIAGLGLGALYLLIDDIVTYFTGKGNSVTGVVVEAIKDLREQLEINPNMDVWQGIADAIEKIMNALGFDFDAKALKELFEANPNLDTWGKISHIISEIGKTFGLDINPDILIKIGDNIKKLGETITGGDNIPTFLTRVANGLINLGLVVIDNITAGAASLAEGIVGLIDSVTGGQPFLDWLGDVFTDLSKFTVGTASALISAATSLAPKIRDLISSITGGKSLIDWLGDLAKGLIGLAGNELGDALTVVTGLLDTLSGIWNGDWDKAISGADRMASGIKKAIEDLFNFIVGYDENKVWAQVLEQGGLKGMIARAISPIVSSGENEKVTDTLTSTKWDLAGSTFFGLFKKDKASDLDDDQLAKVVKWLDYGGTVNAFSQFLSPDVTAADIRREYEKRGSPEEKKIDVNEFISSRGYLHDGIIQPGGGITRVDPDDWVFAVKNVADLAAAFMPRGNTYSGGNQIVNVNQTVNVSGGNLTPATVSSAAKQGMSQALNEMLSRSVNRYQMMSGMR